MTENELHDPQQPPRLKSLDLAALGAAVGADAEGMVCDIDDPDCEAPAVPAATSSAATSASQSPREPAVASEQ